VELSVLCVWVSDLIKLNYTNNILTLHLRLINFERFKSSLLWLIPMTHNSTHFKWNLKPTPHQVFPPLLSHAMLLSNITLPLQKIRKTPPPFLSFFHANIKQQRARKQISTSKEHHMPLPTKLPIFSSFTCNDLWLQNLNALDYNTWNTTFPKTHMTQHNNNPNFTSLKNQLENMQDKLGQILC
jgi:hypothetical protein